MVAGRHISLMHRQYAPLRAQFFQGDSILFGPGGQIVASDPIAVPPATVTPSPNAISAASVSQVAVPNPNEPSGNALPAARIPSESPVPMVSTPPTGVAATSELFLPSSSLVAFAISSSLLSTTLATSTTVQVATSTEASLSSSSSLNSSPSLTTSLASTSITSPAWTSSSTTASALIPLFTPTPTESYSSTSSLAVSSLPTATPSAINAAVASPHHMTSLYFGIAVGAIAFISLIFALIVWYIRTRKRSRTLSSSGHADNWPWDPDHDARHLENGTRSWDHASVTEIKYDDTSTRSRSPRGLFELPAGYELNGTGGTCRTPGNPEHGTPYPTVHINAHQSVPDLASDAGRLQVTNYMPGDISSGDEASRANSRQGNTSEYGSPVAALDSARPRFLGLDGNGLDVPWTVKPSEQMYDDLPELPFPGTAPITDQSTQAENAGWAASIRSNLKNAFHAVVGPPSKVHDSFTQAPERHDTRRSIRSQFAEIEIDGALNRTKTSMSDKSNYDDGMGLVRLASLHRGDSNDWEDLSAWMSGEGSVALPEQPPAAVIKTRDRTQPGTLSRSSSLCEVPEYCDSTPRVLTPGLFARQSSLSLSQPSSLKIRKKTLLQIRNSRKISKKSHRLQLKSRTSSEHSSLSVGSDMSRNSSLSRDPLTEQERFASLALRERRKRLMNHECEL